MPEGVQQTPADPRIGHPTITLGRGRTNPQGVHRPLDVEDGVVEGWRRILNGIRPDIESWWSPHVWQRDYALAKDWIGAHGLAIDIDYEDPSLGSARHTETPAVARQQIDELLSGSGSVNLWHLTPRGARAIVVFAGPCSDRLQMACATRAVARRLSHAIDEAKLAVVDPPGGGHVAPGLAVDASCFNFKALFWAPRCIVNGELREAEVFATGVEPFRCDELACDLPETEAHRVARELGLVTEGERAPQPAADSDYRAAADRWNAEHPMDYHTPQRLCPACGHKGCFGPCPQAPGRWFCFSANHGADAPGCGAESPTQPGAYWGDALDLEAHRRGTTPAGVLRADGYLEDRASDGGSSSVDLSGLLQLGVPGNGPVDGWGPGLGWQPGEVPVAPLPSFTVVDLEDQPVRPALVQRMMRRGSFGAIYGPSGTGKSFVVLSLALALAWGHESWMGLGLKAPAPVLYVAGEGQEGIVRRVRAWHGGEQVREGVGVENLRVVPDMPSLLDPQSVRRVVATIEVWGTEPALVIVDTLAWAMAGADENKAGEMGMVMANVKAIRDATGVAVLLVHHTGKAGGPERGSGALRGASDFMLALRTTKEPDVIELSADKTKDGRSIEPIPVELEEVEWGEVDEFGDPITSMRAVLRDPAKVVDLTGLESAGRGSPRAAVLRFLRRLPDGERLTARTADVMRALGEAGFSTSKSTYYDAVRALESMGAVTTERGAVTLRTDYLERHARWFEEGCEGEPPRAQA